MGTHRFNLAPASRDITNQAAFRAGTLFLWGRYASDPAGTKFHFKVIPTQIPQAMTDAGKSVEVRWLRRIWGDGQDVATYLYGDTSPAVVVPLPPDWDPPIPQEYPPSAGAEGDPAWAEALEFGEGGVPRIGVGWDWAIGAGLAICYPFDWVSPSPSQDEFKFRVEVWSSREEIDPEDPEGPPLNVADSYLYTLLDNAWGYIESPITRINSSGYQLRLCPGMVGSYPMQVRVATRWVDEVLP